MCIKLLNSLLNIPSHTSERERERESEREREKVRLGHLHHKKAAWIGITVSVGMYLKKPVVRISSRPT